jgi:hypothetical protein
LADAAADRCRLQGRLIEASPSRREGVVSSLKSWADMANEEGDGDIPLVPIHFVLSLAGRSIPLWCDNGNTVKELFGFVAALTGARPDSVHITLGPEPVANDHVLASDEDYHTEYGPPDLAWAEQRREDARKAAVFHLGHEMEEVLLRGTYVNQDNSVVASGRERARSCFRFIGTELAYTYNLKTCTALTICHASTGLSLLHHVDSEVPQRRITGWVDNFMAPGPGTPRPQGEQSRARPARSHLSGAKRAAPDGTHR